MATQAEARRSPTQSSCGSGGGGSQALQNYKVVLENDQVRVLRIKYGAHDRPVMHVHRQEY